jgi:hypothetical protein
MKKLKKVNEKLKKFDGVNKKALDQFLSFTEQRDDLQSRESSLLVTDLLSYLLPRAPHLLAVLAANQSTRGRARCCALCSIPFHPIHAMTLQ